MSLVTRRRRRSDEESWLLSYADLITNLLIFFAALLAASQISTTKMQEVAEQLSGKETKQSLKQVRREIDAEIAGAGLKEVVRTDLTERGLEIAIDTGIMFETASAAINPAWQSVLDQVITKIAPYSANYQLAVEGHTDSRPITVKAGSDSRFESNWDLSSARANEIRKRLEIAGIAKNRMRLEAYADTMPLPPEKLKNLSGEDVLARHRRVVIRLF